MTADALARVRLNIDGRGPLDCPTNAILCYSMLGSIYFAAPGIDPEDSRRGG
jgi:hypothetical protein